MTEQFGLLHTIVNLHLRHYITLFLSIITSSWVIARWPPNETAIARDYLNDATGTSICLRVSLLLGIVD